MKLLTKSRPRLLLCLKKCPGRRLRFRISLSHTSLSSWLMTPTASDERNESAGMARRKLTSFWKLVLLSNSLRWHFWDIDWHLCAAVSAMDCPCQAWQVWWRIRSPNSKTMQWPRRPSSWMDCSRWGVFLATETFKIDLDCSSRVTLHDCRHTVALFAKYQWFFFVFTNATASFPAFKCHSIYFRHY